MQTPWPLTTSWSSSTLGYDLTRLAWLLADLPVEVMAGLRSDRVMYFPAPPRPARPAGTGGRPPRHGTALKLADPQTWPAPAVTTSHRDHPVRHRPADGLGRLTSSWPAAPAGRTTTASCRSSRAPSSGWPSITCPATAARNRYGCGHHRRDSAAEVNRTWQAFLRRFDLEHTFRFLKQVLGWTRPKLRDPAAADRWTWLIIACYAQLYLARHLAADIRLPWQRPCPPGRLTPARVRRGFRNIRQMLPCPASAPKPGKPGPGRPPGSKNSRPATRHDVGKPSSETSPTRKPASRRVAVGTALAGGPPHRSQRAGLPHWAPTLGVWRRSAPPGRDACRGRVVATGSRSGASAPR